MRLRHVTSVTISRYAASVRLGGTIVLLLAAFACSPSDDSDAAYVVDDRSGTRIVQNNRAAWESEDRWQLAAEPRVMIGDASDGGAGTFFGIRGVDLTSDGGVVVLDGGSAELRRYPS